MNAVTIRFATINDAALIADISQRTFYDAFASFNTKENIDKFMTNEFYTEKLIAQVGQPGNIFLLAYYEGQIVGYVLLVETNNRTEFGNANAIEIARIYSEQKTIGKGIGKALMQKCIEIAKEKRKKIIWLGVWEHNERAISFYTKWGFEKFGDHIFMLGDDAQTDWLMKKEL